LQVNQLQIRTEPWTYLETYARIPIAFEVRQVLDLSLNHGGLGGFTLSERTLTQPQLKDYDAISENRPLDWPKYFDTTHWGLLSASLHGADVGGAVIAFMTPGLDLLERRGDLAVLWDLRVLPELRGQGVGAALFAAAERWAEVRGCTQLKIETQNVNLPACRFYLKQGCVLGSIHRFAYPELPEEIQLFWYKQLEPVAGD